MTDKNYRVRHILCRRTPPPPKLNLPLINFGVINILWISARPPSRGQWYHGLIKLEVTFLKILQFLRYCVIPFFGTMRLNEQNRPFLKKLKVSILGNNKISISCLLILRRVYSIKFIVFQKMLPNDFFTNVAKSLKFSTTDRVKTATTITLNFERFTFIGSFLVASHGQTRK